MCSRRCHMLQNCLVLGNIVSLFEALESNKPLIVSLALGQDVLLGVFSAILEQGAVQTNQSG